MPFWHHYSGHDGLLNNFNRQDQTRSCLFYFTEFEKIDVNSTFIFIYQKISELVISIGIMVLFGEAKFVKLHESIDKIYV